MTTEQTKIEISYALKAFSSGTLTNNSMNLFQVLGYNTQRNAHLSKPDYKTFNESYLSYNLNFNEAKAFTADWKYIDLLFQLSKSEVSKQTTLFDTKKVDNTLIETYLFFVIELIGDHYTRGNLSSITREVNKVFPMPVMILFRHNNSLTLSVINRRLHKRDETKDVLEKVTLIKEIDIINPHRAHIEILFDLSFEQLKYKHNFTNFVELHEAWQKTLDTKELNKKFFQELANWYFWAISKTNWPDDDEQLKKKEVRNATNVIRLITRLIFIWFLKEKKLVDGILFNEKELKSILNNSDSNDSTYYKAILQNLFFATLNTPLDKRIFRTKRTYQGKNNDRGNPFVFRYENFFIKDITELYEHIPFLNGGLFDCLDYKNENGKMVHIDGFSEENDNPLKVPDKLFFSKPTIIDLSSIYNDNKKSKSEVRGLINILDSYKFTITENTPIEEEVALDPELLGRVFENLLAYYNPETETTARKQTGSFYTPREIVNYMVDESLIAYLKTKMLAESFSYLAIGSDQMDLLGNKSRKGQLKIEEDVNPNRWIGKEENLENELRSLLSYSESELHFNLEEKKALVKAIDNIKVLDPACGSGAFPMGMLHKLVHILHRLDPKNQMWKKKQVEFASQIQEPIARENALKNIEDVFNPENNFADYGRKLFLIRNCIYGIDIQPIAIQIAKLRFFISLLIDQSINNKKDNHNIDPLPNLESKFVAANTLIGLQKSTSTGNLFDENYDKIVQLKAKFEEIRKKYFNVRLPQEKKKFHDEYLKTRDELIKILKKDKGYSVDAPLLVEYDPYNPLNVSPFFDVEWMFGLDGFDIVIGNPPYLEARHSSFDEKSKLLILNSVKNRWANDSIYFSRGSDLLVYFFETAIYNMNKDGVVCFITQNSWLNTDYGQKFQAFLIKNTNINFIADSNFKHFVSNDGPNINTVITLFSRKKLSQDNVVNFIKYTDSFDNIAIKKTFLCEDPILKKLKWGTLFNSNSITLELIKILNERGKGLDYYGLTIGQGLNLMKSYHIDIDEAKEYSLPKKSLVPILTSDDGAFYILDSTNKYLVDQNYLSKEQIKILAKKHINVFDFADTKKQPPKLILPRGIGRHFCAFNNIQAYSASFVDIYDESNNFSEEQMLNLWLFLNSSITWLLREISGRKNLGGGMLKAEATDLKSLPLYFNFNSYSQIKNLYKKLIRVEIKSTLKEMHSIAHKEIDDLVFQYLNIPNETKMDILNTLQEIILERTQKSQS
jgi:hypothetical protein